MVFFWISMVAHVYFLLSSWQVAQYIQFNLSFLESILHRINEEEQQEIEQTIAR